MPQFVHDREVLQLIIGFALILTVLWEAFETIILPRRVHRRFRLTRLYYRSTWRPWSALAMQLRSKSSRETWLSFFGPLSLIGLLVLWAGALVLGFALIHVGLGLGIREHEAPPNFETAIYLSASTFFTLGLGDVVPITWPERAITALEAGVGFGFLALVIGYLPVIYQSFSRREVIISMLDSRAGSPPTAVELLRRHAESDSLDKVDELLRDWEEWAAELLESHLSYPVLAYFRSQHDNQSWLAALTTILDASALVMAGLKGRSFRQARLTFAMARHTVVDLSQVFDTHPDFNRSDRLHPSDLPRLHAALQAAGLETEDVDGQRLAHFRRMYEPYVHALARFLRMNLPPWIATTSRKDNWQTTAWQEENE
jgi:ion channel